MAPWQVITDLALQEIAEAPPSDRAALATVAALGPRALQAFGEELLALLRSPPDDAGNAGSGA